MAAMAKLVARSRTAVRSTLGVRSGIALGRAGLTCLLLLGAVAPASAQGKWKKKVTNAAKGTAVGRAVTGLSAEAEMLDAAVVDLEQSGLQTLTVGALTFAIAAVEIKNDRAVRVKAYLLNPTSQEAKVPVPDAELFVLVDSRGRRLERVSSVEVDQMAKGSTEIIIPSIERVELSLLFTGAKADAPTATLKVGTLGTIGGIPVHTSAAPQASAAANGNVWAPAQAQPPQPSPPPPAPPEPPPPPPPQPPPAPPSPHRS